MPLNSTDNITNVTEEDISRAQTPSNQYPPFITNDEAGNTTRDMQSGHDSRDGKAGQHN